MSKRDKDEFKGIIYYQERQLIREIIVLAAVIVLAVALALLSIN